MSTLAIVAIVLGGILLNVLLAYVPIILIVGYNLSEQKRDKDLLERYVTRDEISTQEYIALTEGEWQTVTHAPLRKDT